LYDEFKVAYEEKADGRIKEEKPSTATPGNDRGGGKFSVPIFS
jgi:hypothetical protein